MNARSILARRRARPRLMAAAPWMAAGLAALALGACIPPVEPPPPAVASVRITAVSDVVAPDQWVPATATAHDAQGNALQGRTFAWATSNAAVAMVDQDGRVRGVSPGTAEIRATSGGVTGVLPVRVAVTRLQPLTPNLNVTVGALHPDSLRVRLTDAAGEPVAGATVHWVPAPDPADGWLSDGWVFPAVSTTDASGVARTRWVPGRNAGQLVLAVAGTDTARVLGRATKTANSANSVHLWHYVPGSARAQAFRTELLVQTDPPDSYYAAIGSDGFYTGMQVSGDLGGKQVIFSAWDQAGGNAQLVDAAASTCEPFGGEGTGIKCRFLYDWQPNRPYRFEVEAAPGTGTTDLTAWFTDVSAGTTVKVATLRLAKVSSTTYAYAFAEDFGPASPSCLDASLRAAIVRNAEYRLNGTWQRFATAYFTHYHPRTVCANVSAASLGGGVQLVTGGWNVGDPSSSTTFSLP